ncbi:MAG TPA: glycosyltransferase, partial [Acidimicrobiales bacterium]|nr:glycosyltransferase [Acidimicrobiales bacterium]
EAGEDEPELSARRDRGETAAIGCSDAVLASSRVERQELVRLYGADPERVTLVPPGVDRAFFSPGDQAQARRALALPADAAIVLFVGRIQPLKGLVTAVRTLDKLVHRQGRASSAHLVVIGGPSGTKGDDELKRAFELLSGYGLDDRAVLVPPQPHERLSTYYRAADACIVPSRSESFGLVALEAAACGVPVVASAVGGLRELVDHGRTGYLVAPDDVAGFAHYLGEVLSDRALGRLLGAAASERSAAYTWGDAASRIATLVESLTQRDLVSCT